MAEEGSWPDIKRNGLLSTSALLDRYGVTGSTRVALEEAHRPDKVTLGGVGDQVVLRDQKPMQPARLQPALRDGLTSEQWYRLLNAKVFMWAEEHRLLRLLRARHYRSLEHVVLTLDTASLVAAHEKTVWLSPMNSGNTFPMPALRGTDTFLRIADYPTKVSRPAPHKPVVEVCVDYSIPDIAEHVIQVRRMTGDVVLGELDV